MKTGGTNILLNLFKGLFPRFRKNRVLVNIINKGYKFDNYQDNSIYNVEIDDLNTLGDFNIDYNIEDLNNVYLDKNGASYTCPLSAEKIKIGDIVIICDVCSTYHKKVFFDSFKMTKCQSCRKDISSIMPKTIR